MKFKKNVFIFIIMFIFIFSCIFLHYKNTQKKLESDISVMREIYFDTISITKIDFNNYSADINFKELTNSVTNEDFWKNSMTQNYINSFDLKQLSLKKSLETVEMYFKNLSDLHKTQIDFLSTNKIPLDKIESAEYNSKNSFESKISEEVSLLEDKLNLISEYISSDLNSYKKYLNRYGIKINLNKERKDYDLYFKEEYEDLMEKRFTEKIDRIIKKEL